MKADLCLRNVENTFVCILSNRLAHQCSNQYLLEINQSRHRIANKFYHV